MISEVGVTGFSITILYAGALALLGVLLANLVLYVRLRGQTQPPWRADATLRTQANFVENVPLALLLLGGLELSQMVPGFILHVFGIWLLLCRLLHAWGMSSYPGANYPRLIGAQGTFLLLSVMGVSAVAIGLQSL